MSGADDTAGATAALADGFADAGALAGGPPPGACALCVSSTEFGCALLGSWHAGNRWTPTNDVAESSQSEGRETFTPLLYTAAAENGEKMAGVGQRAAVLILGQLTGIRDGSIRRVRSGTKR